MSLFLIVLAAGNSKRFKSDIPKPYITINQKKKEILNLVKKYFIKIH